jgi:hypothetical protein
MQTQNHSKSGLQKAGSYVFNFGVLAGIATLTFGLISCGGGGGGSSPDTVNGALTITEITPPGIVASSVFQTIVLSGTNFASGVTLTITGASGTPVVSSVAVTNSNTLTAQVQITTAPTNRYVTVSVQPASSAVPVTHILGVANTRVTYANILSRTYFTTNCTGCHSSSMPSNEYLDLTNANGLINQASYRCGSRLRVTRGDPRQSSNYLIDKIQAPTGSATCFGVAMPKSGTKLQASEIQDFIEWIAGGTL